MQNTSYYPKSVAIIGILISLVASSHAQQVTPTENDPTAVTTPKSARGAKETADVKLKDDEVVQLDPFEVKSERDYGYQATNSMTATGSGTEIRNTPLNIDVFTSEFIQDKGATDIRDIMHYTSSFTANPSKDEQEVFGRGFQSVIKSNGAVENRGVFSLDNADRVEVIKGPAAIMQGDSSVGGTVNIISKRPSWRRQQDLTYSFGSWGYQKLNVGSTGPLLKDRIAYNLRYTYTNAEGWFDYTYRDEKFYAGAVTFKPFQRLELTLGFEDSKRVIGNQQHAVLSHPVFMEKDLEAYQLYDSKGLARPASYPKIGEAIRAWLNRTAGFGANEPSQSLDVTNIFFERGYQENLQGPQQHRSNKSQRQTAELRWQPTEWLSFRGFYYHSENERDNNDMVTFRPSGGLAFNVAPTEILEKQKRDDLTSQFVTQFSFWGFNHRLLVGHQYRVANTASKSITAKATLHYPGTVYYIQDEINANNPNGFGVFPDFGNITVHALYITDQFSGFNERLHVSMGQRWNQRMEGDDNKRSSFTPTIGAVLRLPKLEGVSVYGSYSQGYVPTFARDADGNLLPVQDERNLEGGLKIDLFGGKLSGTASIFKMQQTNVPIRDFAREAELGRSPLYIFSGLNESSGFEFDAKFSPIKNFQMVLSYSSLWQAETVEAQDVRMIGVRNQGSPRSQFSIYNKYTFVTGKLRGLYVGSGLRWVGEMHIHPSWDVPLNTDPYWYGDLLVGYKWQWKKVAADLSVRAENIFDQLYYESTFRMSSPRRAFVNLRLSF